MQNNTGIAVISRLSFCNLIICHGCRRFHFQAREINSSYLDVPNADVYKVMQSLSRSYNLIFQLATR